MSGYSKVTDSSEKTRLKAIGVSINSTPVSLREVTSFIVCPLPKRALTPRHRSRTRPLRPSCSPRLGSHLRGGGLEPCSVQLPRTSSFSLVTYHHHDDTLRNQ